MKKFYIGICIVFCLINIETQAQDLSYGFKAGLNFSTFSADLEKANDGSSEESYDFNSGFHVGIIFTNKFTDLFGVKGEFLYSQKGSRYNLKGSSYQPLINDAGEYIMTTGEKDLNLNITNAYLDVPISAYVKALSWLEVHAGFSIGAMVSSSGSGDISYSGVTQSGIQVEEFVTSFDHKYFSDKGGIEDFGDEPQILNFDGNRVEIPESLPAYYDYEQGKDLNLYNRLDFGLHAGVSIYLNQGLFLGLRVNYGLMDINDNEVDKSNINLDANSQYIYSQDVDRNLSLQTSVGFSF